MRLQICKLVVQDRFLVRVSHCNRSCRGHKMCCRDSWKALAAGKGPPGPQGAAEGQHVHLQFCNMIINDSTYLLGEALEKLPQVRDLEALMDDKAAWDALSQREQQEKESVLRQESGSQRSWAINSAKHSRAYLGTLLDHASQRALASKEALPGCKQHRQAECSNKRHICLCGLYPHASSQQNLGCAAGQFIKHHLTSASIAVRTLEYTTTQVTSTWLLPEMVLRVANMLNYFLQFLTGEVPCLPFAVGLLSSAAQSIRHGAASYNATSACSCGQQQQVLGCLICLTWLPGCSCSTGQACVLCHV